MKKLLLASSLFILAVGCGQQAINDKKADPRIVAASDMLIGTWSSEDDRNFEREYEKDGTMEDSYGSVNGDVETEGTWTLFTSDNAPSDVTFQLNNTDMYVKHVMDGGDTHYFRVVSVTSTELELVNMDKGGAIRFGKMPTGQELRDGQED